MNQAADTSTRVVAVSASPTCCRNHTAPSTTNWVNAVSADAPTAFAAPPTTAPVTAPTAPPGDGSPGVLVTVWQARPSTGLSPLHIARREPARDTREQPAGRPDCVPVCRSRGCGQHDQEQHREERPSGATAVQRRAAQADISAPCCRR